MSRLIYQKQRPANIDERAIPILDVSLLSLVMKRSFIRIKALPSKIDIVCNYDRYCLYGKEAPLEMERCTKTVPFNLSPLKRVRGETNDPTLTDICHNSCHGGTDLFAISYKTT